MIYHQTTSLSCSRSVKYQRCSTSASGRSVISSLRVIFRRFVLDVVFASKNKLFATLSMTDERTMMTAQGWRCVIRKENANV
jgi:hypothetical protein